MPTGRWFIEDETEGIIERVVISCRLTLETPAHFGNGEVSILTDMPLMRDSYEGKALLSGASIAGALRAYLLEESGKQNWANWLFGYNHPDQNIGYASLLAIDDAFGNAKKPATELRDGVSIDPRTRTADKGQLYNIELLSPGLSFNLQFELLIPNGWDGGRLPQEIRYGETAISTDAVEEGINKHYISMKKHLLRSLAIPLAGLQRGEIGLGKRKRRGFGQCRASHWRVQVYDMRKPDDLIAWLARPAEASPATDAEYEAKGDDIVTLLADLAHFDLPPSERSTFNLEADFSLAGSSLLIRSYGSDPTTAETIHLRSNGKPVLSGTSLAGALRARARRIVNTLALPTGKAVVEGIFGPEPKAQADRDLFASRLIVRETEIKAGYDLVQSRIKIDRFTGGTYPGALFNEQALFGKMDTRVKVSLCLLYPKDDEIGLLLMLLKDLWTGDLPLGGEASIGRGRLQGREATLTYKTPHKSDSWTLHQSKDGPLEVSAATQAALEHFAQALHAEEK